MTLKKLVNEICVSELNINCHGNQTNEIMCISCILSMSLCTVQSVSKTLDWSNERSHLLNFGNVMVCLGGEACMI